MTTARSDERYDIGNVDRIPGDIRTAPEMTGPLTTLFRPVGQAELDLIAASGFRRFPPRLPGQPIFYPVLTEAYAVEIARDWNTRDEASGFAGYVLRFFVDTGFLARYPEQIAGAARHRELWVPAEELEEFNRHIVGPIEVVAEFHGRTSEAQTPGSPSDATI